MPLQSCILQTPVLVHLQRITGSLTFYHFATLREEQTANVGRRVERQRLPLSSATALQPSLMLFCRRLSFCALSVVEKHITFFWLSHLLTDFLSALLPQWVFTPFYWRVNMISHSNFRSGLIKVSTYLGFWQHISFAWSELKPAVSQVRRTEMRHDCSTVGYYHDINYCFLSQVNRG